MSSVRQAQAAKLTAAGWPATARRAAAADRAPAAWLRRLPNFKGPQISKPTRHTPMLEQQIDHCMFALHR